MNVYTDGSVLLAHGGTEMGQGLHTKMIQVRVALVMLVQVAALYLGCDGLFWDHAMPTFAVWMRTY